MSDTILTINPVEFNQIPLFSSVSMFDVEDIILKWPLLRIGAGPVIIAAGQPNERMYIVLCGEVCVHLDTLESQSVATLTRGDVFGELSVILANPPQLTSSPKVAVVYWVWTVKRYGNCFVARPTSLITYWQFLAVEYARRMCSSKITRARSRRSKTHWAPVNKARLAA
jgi:CRP-like cAMP-binding protein